MAERLFTEEEMLATVRAVARGEREAAARDLHHLQAEIDCCLRQKDSDKVRRVALESVEGSLKNPPESDPFHSQSVQPDA